jgi:dehydrogenase/reductase SDR family member 7
MVAHPGYIKTNAGKNALVGDGSKSFGKTDSNIRNGLDVNFCAEEILKGIQAKKTEVWISHSPIVTALLYIGRLVPWLSDFGLYKNLSQQLKAVDEAE